jgi:hypothetical protein
MSENNVTKEALRRKHLKEIEQDLYEIRQKQTQFQFSTNVTSSKLEEIRFKIELIKYLTAELEVTKAELRLLRKSAKESR